MPWLKQQNKAFNRAYSSRRLVYNGRVETWWQQQLRVRIFFHKEEAERACVCVYPLGMAGGLWNLKPTLIWHTSSTKATSSNPPQTVLNWRPRFQMPESEGEHLSHNSVKALQKSCMLKVMHQNSGTARVPSELILWLLRNTGCGITACKVCPPELESLLDISFLSPCPSHLERGWTVCCPSPYLGSMQLSFLILHSSWVRVWCDPPNKSWHVWILWELLRP